MRSCYNMWQCKNCGNMNEGENCAFCNAPQVSYSDETVGSFGFNPQVPNEEKTTAYTQMEYETYADNQQQFMDNGQGMGVPNQVPNDGNIPQGYSYSEPYNQPNYTYNQPQYAPQPPKKKSSNTILWVICGILLAVLIGLGGFFVYVLIDNSTTVSRVDYDDDDKDYKDDEDSEDEDEIKISDDEIEAIISSKTSHTEFNIYVKNLTTGYEYGYNEYDKVLASAASQIVILDTLSEMQYEGYTDIDDDELYFEYTPNGKQAPDSPAQDGTYLTIRECIEDVATYGDNNKSNMLFDYIGYLDGSDDGAWVINNRMKDLDYPRTTVNRKIIANADPVDSSVPKNSTSAYEIGNIYENLITNSSFGSKSYMLKLFKSVDVNGNKYGLKAHIPSGYLCSNVNGNNTQTTNNVAYISKDDTEIIVVLLSSADDAYKNIENNEVRDQVQKELIEYILETQFSK